MCFKLQKAISSFPETNAFIHEKIHVLTIQRYSLVQNFNMHKILTRFLPRAIKHAIEIWTLRQIDFVQIPYFTQCHNGYVGILLFLKQGLIDVLRCGQKFLSESKSKMSNDHKQDINKHF